MKIEKLEKFIKSKQFKKELALIKRLEESVNKIIPSTPDDLDWATSTASEYNPMNFTQAKRFMIKLLKLKKANKYVQGMTI